jgi:hypothetical protein
MINRKAFKELFNQYKPGLGDDKSPLWEPERYEDNRPSRWFVKIRPLAKDNRMKDYWLWCHQNCSGQILCYSSDSDNQEEWWGFTHQADIVFWLLRWS